MIIDSDLHVHTLVSHHAYSTLGEICEHSAQIGMKAVAITDHAYGGPDSGNDWHFGCMWVFPRQIKGVYVLRGAEANIMDYDGNIDLNDYDQKFLDYIIASMHTYCIKPGSKEENTRACEGAIRNPYVDTLGHPMYADFDVDHERVVRCCAEEGKMIELNAHVLRRKPETLPICQSFLRLCMEHGVKIAVASDAHICYDIGRYEKVYELLENEKFPEALIFNRHTADVLEYVNQKSQIKDKFE